MPGGGEDVQHLLGQQSLWQVQAVQQEEEEGNEVGQGGAEGDHQ